MGEKHGDIYTYNPSNMMIWDNVCVCTNRYTTVYPLVYPTISCCNLIPGNMIRLNQGMEWGILCCQFPSRHRKKNMMLQGQHTISLFVCWKTKSKFWWNMTHMVDSCWYLPKTATHGRWTILRNTLGTTNINYPCYVILILTDTSLRSRFLVVDLQTGWRNQVYRQV
jgi:hypothetical protein